MNKTVHVSTNGSDTNTGTDLKHLKTISKAATIAEAGDTIIVHEGTYREWVNPINGGQNNNNRITYRAAKNEKVIIKGSEVINTWEAYKGDVWQVKIPNSFFGDFNPYASVIDGDWFVYPDDDSVHAGDVYLNGRSFYEAKSLSEVENPVIRDKGFKMPLSDRIEYLLKPEDTAYLWFATVDDSTTTIYANFQGANPNQELVEINVRKCCFYPKKTGVNYITVSGFEMSQAATLWAPPTGDQVGLLGAHWSKGWIIENNIIHDSKCSAISIGKESSTGDNLSYKMENKSGYQYQMEAVFKGLSLGWNKDNIGSHIVRNNKIYDCGQNGIVGHLGCVFSEIYNNHIFNIGIKYEYFGWEIAGIKLHAPIDVTIKNNRVHDCSLGLWLDWQSQGTRVSSNLLYRNQRDCTIEVTHGPLVFDNNILASSYNFDNHAQGTAFVNNLLCGTMSRKRILDRATPYHYPHSTDVAGYAFVYGGDERLYNNIFYGTPDVKRDGFFEGTAGYNDCPPSYEVYHKNIVEKGRTDEEKYVEVMQPAYIDGNAYLNAAKAYEHEKNNCFNKSDNTSIVIEEKGSEVFLEINVTKEMLELETAIQSTETLGTVRLLDAVYDDTNANPIILDRDYFGTSRAKTPKVGPIENLKLGLNRIKVW